MMRLLSPRELWHKLLVKGKRLPSVHDGYDLPVAAPGGDGSDSDGSHASDDDEVGARKQNF
eukprot:scaffold119489_cov28-Tisochrysis_lutea.AAC.10